MSFRLEQNSILFNKHIMTAVIHEGDVCDTSRSIRKLKNVSLEASSNDYLLIKALFIIITRSKYVQGVYVDPRGACSTKVTDSPGSIWLFGTQHFQLYLHLCVVLKFTSELIYRYTKTSWTHRWQ
ncbi:hypothetical protein NQ317_012666 [Molorchus minor]|uniref:Uncharacterized protein n=1 Tax=Molorchus minor TaxID=1323400 RepID=A0ABQ9ITS6_9CUCU|nr:hypothetical protein NQ317_012666 [Molorchus minor]